MGFRAMHLSRRVMIGALASACVSAPRRDAPNVLFVCQHGTVKSPVAREHLRRMAATRGIAVNVQSRGIAPEDAMSPQLTAALAADGIDAANEPVRRLTAADLAAADIIIVFNPLPAEFGAWPVRDWSDVGSMNQDYAGARAMLMPRLEALVAELAGSS